MVMRPATPLSVLFFVAFALLLLSSLSTPVIKAIPIASHNGHTFGVWGYCEGNECSKIGIGYDMTKINGISSDDFSLPEGTRNSLSSILVITPVAAFLALVCTILAIAAHFHSPAHSPRFLLGLFILTIPTLIASLLAFLVDILIFIPHVSWGGWIAVAATVIIAVAGLVTCGMRRSLVSRKARRKRIQENAEMNGANYFDTMAQKSAGVGGGDAMGNNVAISVISDLPRAESPPPLTGGSTAPLNAKSNSTFATYDSTPSPEDKLPLRMNNAPPAMTAGPVYGGQAPRPRNGSIPRQVDQYGNPIAPMGRPSLESARSGQSSRSDPRYFGGAGGRGGYPPSGRGGYPPRGGPMMRGGPGMRGGYRGPPRGGPGMGPPPGMMMGRGGPPPGYGPQDRYTPSPYEQQGQRAPPAYEQGQRGMSPQGLARQNAPPEMAIGQAIEMDANNGVPSPALSPVNTTPPDEYQQPTRAQWSSRPPPNGNRALSPIQASPIDSVSKYSQTQVAPMGHTRSGSGSYYEDVEPRFAPEDNAVAAPAVAGATGPHMTASSMAVPSLLLATSRDPMPRGIPQGFTQQPPPEPLDTLRQESQESLQEGQRSPATSDTSHFTSVSQRGVNPRWPGLAQQNRGPPPQSRPSDVLLNSNPDFSLPGMGARRGGGPPRGPGRQSPAMGIGGLGQPSRYPMA